MLIVRESNEPNGQCPTAATGPHGIIDHQGGLEHFSHFSGEKVPGHSQIARGIAHTQASLACILGEGIDTRILACSMGIVFLLLDDQVRFSHERQSRGLADKQARVHYQPTSQIMIKLLLNHQH
jgi:hypothetical protein